MYDDELEDPKVEQLTDSEYRVWSACLKLCNRAPARLRERGYLYHSKGYPVEAEYIARRLAKPVEEVQAGLDKLLSVGGESSLLTVEDGDGGPVYRIRAWRKRQSGQDENTDNPEKLPESSQKNPSLSAPDVDVDVDVDVDKDVDKRVGASRKRSRPRKLTDEQNDWKQDRIDYWQRCLDVYYNVPEEEHQRFPDSGHAVRFFGRLAKAGKHDQVIMLHMRGKDIDVLRVDEAIHMFFRRRHGWREKRREETPEGQVPPAVPVRVKDFDAQFDELYDLAGGKR